MIETFLYKQFSLKNIDELFLDLDALYNLSSMNPSRIKESGRFRDYVFELLIRPSRVFSYLLGMAVILDFISTL